MFVKLLPLLISNILVSFSVLWCCSSLTSICSKRVKMAKNAHQVPESALEPSRDDQACLHASVQSQHQVHCARAHTISATHFPCCASHRFTYSTVEILSSRAHHLRSSAHRLALECTTCDRAHPRDLATP
jgi:hypothetical protein